MEDKHELDEMYRCSILNEPLVSGVYFNPAFNDMRERGKSSWQIPEHLKIALEQSIVNPVTVTDQSNFACSNDTDAEKKEDLDTGGVW